MMADPRILYSTPQSILPLQQTNRQSTSNATATGTQTGPTFGAVLQQQLGGVKFSQHAQQRLQQRNIQLGQDEITRLGQAVDKAAQKGSRESLVLMDNQLAFVVSVKNRTVITAMVGDNMKENVFTNIDSAVIV